MFRMMQINVNSLHPNIGTNIILKVLLTFPEVLTRTCLTIKIFFQLVIISFILMTCMCDLGVILDTRHS